MIKTELINFSFQWDSNSYHNISNSIIDVMSSILVKYANVRYVKTIVVDTSSVNGISKKYALFSINNSENYFFTICVTSSYSNKQYTITFGLTTEPKATESKLLLSSTAIKCSVTDYETDKRIYLTNYPLYLIANRENNLFSISNSNSGSYAFYFDIDIYTDKAMLFYKTTSISCLFDNIISEPYQIEYMNRTITKSNVCLTENIIFNKDTEIGICKNIKLILLPISDYNGIFVCNVNDSDCVRSSNILIAM